jgi:hypothetical protein
VAATTRDSTAVTGALLSATRARRIGQLLGTQIPHKVGLTLQVRALMIAVICSAFRALPMAPSSLRHHLAAR